MVASRFIVAAAACVILLHFAAESYKSHCNGGVGGGNGALAAVFSDFGRYNFPFKNSISRLLQNRPFSVLALRSGFGAANRCNFWSRCG